MLNKIATIFIKYFGVQCHFTFIASRSLSLCSPPLFLSPHLSFSLFEKFFYFFIAYNFTKFKQNFVICVRHFCLEFYAITQLRSSSGGGGGATVINFIVWLLPHSGVHRHLLAIFKGLEYCYCHYYYYSLILATPPF